MFLIEENRLLELKIFAIAVVIEGCTNLTFKCLVLDIEFLYSFLMLLNCEEVLNILFLAIVSFFS